MSNSGSSSGAVGAGTLSFPILLAEITDDGLRRIEATCRAERLKRARQAGIRAANINDDPDDIALARMTPDQLRAEADRLDAEVSANGEAGGLCDAPH